MKKLSKIEIATYLRDYSKLMEYVIKNPNDNFFDLFKKMLRDENRGQYAIGSYYDNMITIYQFFLLNKKYSFMSDSLFDHILEDRLLQINIDRNVFVNSEDYNKFSKKQIIKFIRNALNHNNNDDRELYSLYINQKNAEIEIEIFLKNTKPIPFHIKINVQDYINIMEALYKASKLDLTYYKTTSSLDLSKTNDLDSELDKIVYRRYYFNNKLEAREFQRLYGDKKAPISIENLDKSEISHVDYHLTTPQKLKILEELKKWSVIDKDGNISIDYILPTVIPLGVAKYNLLNFNFIIANYYLKSFNKSYNDIFEDVRDIHVNPTNVENPLYDYNEEKKQNTSIVLQGLDFFSNINLALSIYYGYMFDTVITDEFVKINGKDYPREKIRNSFVHGRWFNGINDCFKLYDCDNGDKNELNYNWRISIPADYIKETVEKYYNENKKSVFYEYPMFIEFNKYKKHPQITLIKEGKTYIYNLDLSTYNPEFIPWGLYKLYGNNVEFVSDFKEIEMFFDEFQRQSEREQYQNEDLAYFTDFIKYQCFICVEYKNGIVNLDELRKNDKILETWIDNVLKKLEENNKKNNNSYM